MYNLHSNFDMAHDPRLVADGILLGVAASGTSLQLTFAGQLGARPWSSAIVIPLTILDDALCGHLPSGLRLIAIAI